MWSLAQGIGVVQALQKPAREYGYHVAIGGGVVNKTFSEKDLDLYFLPMGGFNTKESVTKPTPMLRFLEALWGISEELEKEYEGQPASKEGCYAHAVKFQHGQKRIDCFIFK